MEQRFIEDRQDPLRTRTRRLRLLGGLVVILLAVLSACGAEGTEGTVEEPGNETTTLPEDTDSGTSTTEEATVDTSDSEPITWIWDHALSIPGTGFEISMVEDLPVMLAEATDGRLQLDVRVGQTNPADGIRPIQQGRVDGGMLFSVVLEGQEPLWSFSQLPLLFDNFDEYEGAIREFGHILNEDFEESTGLVTLTNPGLTSDTFVNTAGQPIAQLEDFEGLRIRSPGPQPSAAIEGFGGTPVNIPFGDMYVSLERGVIDGAINAMDTVPPISGWEVLDYINQWPFGQTIYFVAVNPDSLDALPDDLRQTVETFFAEEFYERMVENTRQTDAEAISTLVSNGMEVVDPSEDQIELARAEVLDDLIEDWVAAAGPKGEDLMNQFQQWKSDN